MILVLPLRHNRFLRSLKSDTLLIIDNFNVTATQDSFLSVVLKYRCQILFTTRSKLDEYCTLPLKEIEDMNALLQLASAFYSEADAYRATVEKIIETVHSHTFAVELAAKLLENGISTPDQLLSGLLRSACMSPTRLFIPPDNCRIFFILMLCKRSLFQIIGNSLFEVITIPSVCF